MDIALKLKRVIATFAAIALFAGTASVALAQTFNDVPTDAWYYSYVEQLVEDGVIDSADLYRPADALNRAELVKIAITAIDGLAGYEAPATPTFDDVSTDAWYYDFVEAAVQLGIVNGYTDVYGNLTGYFGPADTVNRAAATKILVNAFSVPTTLTPASVFPDVTSDAWFYEYVVTAYNQSVLDGYDNGYFGPADPVTRAQVAKLVVLAQSPVERGTGDEDDDEPVDPGVGEGDLEVSLNDNTPASSTLPQKASNIDLFAFDLTAADDAVKITQIVVTRGGVGQASDWDALYLYEGTKRLTTGRSLNSDTNTATFAINLTIQAGKTATIRLVGDLINDEAGASNQHYFYIASAGSITSNAQSVAGDFPAVGNLFTIGSDATAVNTLTATKGSEITQPTIGQNNAEVSTFRLAAGSTNDIALHQISVTQNGSLSSSRITNLKLLRGTDEIATTAGFDADRATLVLATPFVIPKGQSRTFSINANIDGGRTTDTVQIYLDENTDLIAIDQQYGFGAVITNDTYNLANVTATNLKGGTVTVADNGPTAKQIAQNTTNVELLNFAITAGRDLTVRDMDATITLRTGAAGTEPNVDAFGSGAASVEAASTTSTVCVTAGGTHADILADDMISIPTASGTVYAIVTARPGQGVCAAVAEEEITTNNTQALAVTAGTVQEINPYTLVKNVKVVDLNTSTTLQGPMTQASDGADSGDLNTTYTKKFTEDYELISDETRHLSLQADIHQNLASGYQLIAAIDYTGVGYIKDMAANENVAPADIVGGVLTGKTMTVTSNSLTVTKSATPTSYTYVTGALNVPTLGTTLSAGSAGDISVRKLSVRLFANSVVGAWANANGDTAANTLVSSVTLYHGSDIVAGPVTPTLVNTPWTPGTSYYRALFDGFNINIPKGSSKTLVAKVNLLNTATGWLAVGLDPADITAEDTDSNPITATAAADINVTATTKLPLLTVTTAGTLQATAESPNREILLAGSTDKLASKYKFTATKEDFTVNTLTVLNEAFTGTGAFDTPVDTTALGTITIKYPDANSVTQTRTGTLAGGVYTFSNLGFVVPTAGSGVYVEIYADVNSRVVAGGDQVSGQGFRLGLRDTANTVNTFEAVGSASSVTLNDAGWQNAANVNSFMVRTAIPTFTKASTNGVLTTGDKYLHSVAVSSGTNTVALGRLVFNVVNASGGNLHSFKLYRGAELISGTLGTEKANITRAVDGADVTDDDNVLGIDTHQVIVSFNTEETISSSTYHLQAYVANGSTGSVSTSLVGDDDNVHITSIVTGNNGNTNTGQVFVTDTDDGLFDNATDFVEAAGLPVPGRNIIWSDFSAELHSYPTVTAGNVDSDTSSYDWTNGFLLKVTGLGSTTLSQ